MNRRVASTFAVGAVLVVVLAGTVGMTAADAGGTSDVDLLLSGGEIHPAGDESTARLASKSSSSDPSEEHQLYEELTTYLPRNPSTECASRADEESEDSHSAVQPLHHWRCPICDATKLSLGAPTGDPAQEAANNLRSHVKNSDGTGHGPLGTLPAEITRDLLFDHVSVKEMAD